MTGGLVRQSQLLEKYSPWTADPSDPDPWRESGRAKPDGLRYAEASCRRTLEAEQLYYERFEDDAVVWITHLRSSPIDCMHVGTPMALVLLSKTSKPDAKTGTGRRSLAEPLSHPQALVVRLAHLAHDGGTLDAGTLTDQNPFVGMIVVDDSADIRAVAREYGVPGQFVVHEGNLSSSAADCAPTPSEFGIDLPAPLFVGKWHSLSIPPMVGRVSLLCPYKREGPWRVMCKHELLVAVVAGCRDSIFLPVTRGLDVPHRARRFVSPAIASHHTSRTK